MGPYRPCSVQLVAQDRVAVLGVGAVDRRFLVAIRQVDSGKQGDREDRATSAATPC